MTDRIVFFDDRTFVIDPENVVYVVYRRSGQMIRRKVKAYRANRVRAVAAGVAIADEPLRHRPNAKRIKRRPGRVHWRDVLTPDEAAIIEPFERLLGASEETSCWEKLPKFVRTARDRARVRAQRMNQGDPTVGMGNRMKPGPGHPSAKLDWDKVAEIRRSTDGYDDIAKRYGVEVSTIKRIRSNQSWRVRKTEMISFPADRSLSSRRAWAKRRAKALAQKEAA